MKQPVFDDNRSIWTLGAPEPPACPPLAGDSHADVAIIGGGYTGVSAAWHISKRFPERRVVLLEAKRLANGASGRNGGQVLNWVNGLDTHDAESTQRVFEITHGGIDQIFGLISEEGLQVRSSRRGAMEVFTDAKRAEEAHEKVERLNAWGIPLRYLHGDALSSRLRLQGGVGAIFDPTAGQLNGVDFIRAMQPKLLARGVGIYEDCPVLKVEEGAQCRLHTKDGVLRADAVVLATAGYTANLGYFKDGYIPLHSHAFATEPLSPEQQAALGWGEVDGFCDDMDRIAYGALNSDGRIVFGGGSNAAYNYLYGGATAWPGSAEAGIAAVQRRFDACFPGAKGLRIERTWTGTLCITLSRCFSVGVRGEHKNVYYGLGYSGHGVTLANVAGRIIADTYAGEADAWAGLPFFNKPLRGIPPEPLRWVGYKAFTTLTGRSPRRAV